VLCVFDGRKDLNEGIGDLHQEIAAGAEEAEDAIPHSGVALLQNEIMSQVHSGKAKSQQIPVGNVKHLLWTGMQTRMAGRLISEKKAPKG